jgi:hypothetical protein
MNIFHGWTRHLTQLSMTSPTKPKIICFRPGNDAPVASYWDLSP